MKLKGAGYFAARHRAIRMGVFRARQDRLDSHVVFGDGGPTDPGASTMRNQTGTTINLNKSPDVRYVKSLGRVLSRIVPSLFPAKSVEMSAVDRAACQSGMADEWPKPRNGRRQ